MKDCANKYLKALKRSTPSFLSFQKKSILKQCRQHQAILNTFLKVCSTRLSLALAKEKEDFNADFSEPRESLRPKMLDQFKRLTVILDNPGVPPRKHPYSFTAVTRMFREDISELIRERLH